MEELRSLLMSVPDSYADFIDGVFTSLTKNDPEDIPIMIDYLKSNHDVSSSDVIEYLCELQGVDIPDH